jgi:high affinity Mn2+ porin
LNFEQEIAPQVGVFGRLGWSDGHNESFAYAEDDRTLELGGFVTGGHGIGATIALGLLSLATGL